MSLRNDFHVANAHTTAYQTLARYIAFARQVQESGMVKDVIDHAPQTVVKNRNYLQIVLDDAMEAFATIMAKTMQNSDVTFEEVPHEFFLKLMRDRYGSKGYVFADIKCEPRFGVEPGVIDLVYDIREGDQFRVGNIHVKITGDNPHTRRTVALNRSGLRPGDILDIREVRALERRIKQSQLFLDQPQTGVTPRVAIRPPEVKEEGAGRY